MLLMTGALICPSQMHSYALVRILMLPSDARHKGALQGGRAEQQV